MSSVDLDDYCSLESSLFKTFRPFMHLLTRIASLVGVTIARESFVYGVELAEWSTQMESLGFKREPDRRQKVKPTPSV
jgi:hypothetical protein